MRASWMRRCQRTAAVRPPGPRTTPSLCKSSRASEPGPWPRECRCIQRRKFNMESEVSSPESELARALAHSERLY
eukprot:762058-Hanusia_phi.AAC.1